MLTGLISPSDQCPEPSLPVHTSSNQERVTPDSHSVLVCSLFWASPVNTHDVENGTNGTSRTGKERERGGTRIKIRGRGRETVLSPRNGRSRERGSVVNLDQERKGD